MLKAKLGATTLNVPEFSNAGQALSLSLSLLFWPEDKACHRGRAHNESHSGQQPGRPVN